jgi:hypothetical protein
VNKHPTGENQCSRPLYNNLSHLSHSFDFFRESSWKVEAVSGPCKWFMVKKLLAFSRQLGIELVILIGVDDSLGRGAKRRGSCKPLIFIIITPKALKKQAYTNQGRFLG